MGKQDNIGRSEKALKNSTIHEESSNGSTEHEEVPVSNFKKYGKKPLLIILFILLNVAVIAITAFSEFGNTENAAELAEVKMNFWLLIPACLCFVVAILLDILKYVIMLHRAGRKEKSDNNWKIARRTVLLGRYYDNVTPAGFGGQPFQIYYMHKHGGLSSAMATTIPLIGMVTSQLGFLVVAVISIFIGGFMINNSALTATACLGLLFFAFWPVTILIATFLPKATSEIIALVVKFLAKIHIVKDKKEAIKKVRNNVNECTGAIKEVLKMKGLFFQNVLMSVGFYILTLSIPFFVLTAFGGRVDFLPCFVTTVAVTSAVYFVPTPGNAGAAEGTFYLVFSGLASGYTFWAMLVWRFFSYYIYIIMGPIVYYRMHLEKKRSKRVV